MENLMGLVFKGEHLIWMIFSHEKLLMYAHFVLIELTIVDLTHDCEERITYNAKKE